MLANISRVLNDGSQDLRGRVIGIYSFLIGFNILIWIVALLSFTRFPMLVGTALIAYTFGLRHAVDADHISAIDNVTRKLMQENKRPIAVGFFFSLGHSTIVVALSIGIAIAAAFVGTAIPGLKQAGGIIGTSVSALFLFVIAIINLLILWEIFQQFRIVSNGGTYDEETIEEFLNKRGLMGRFFSPMFKIITKSWHMYPLGVLFGLGFDTATEVGLLGISASAAGRGFPAYEILIFPLLFMAGMCLIDTTDGIMMLGAYGWAFVKPVRKLYYNMNITLVSALVALVVGGIEALSLIGSQLNLSGGFWDTLTNLSSNFGVLGYVIIGIFGLSWLFSTLIYKFKKYDELDVKIARKSVSVKMQEIAPFDAERALKPTGTDN